eukprot:2873654-Rhodomonas_salina.1
MQESAFLVQNCTEIVLSCIWFRSVGGYQQGSRSLQVPCTAPGSRREGGREQHTLGQYRTSLRPR